MLDASPEQASDDDFMALTIKEKSMNVFKDPSSFFFNNKNSYVITSILGLDCSNYTKSLLLSTFLKKSKLFDNLWRG